MSRSSFATSGPAAAGAGPALSIEERRRLIELEGQRELLAFQYRQRLRLMQLERAGAQIVYANQAEAAAIVISQFMAGKVWVCLVAPPGAGKTGVILEVLRQLGEHANPEFQIHIENMLLITGMSDKDWERTMKDGILEAFHKIVYHRGALRKKEGMDRMRNGIIVTDECHVAAQKNQTIDKKLDAAGLKSVPTLKNRNMRMLDVSATPEGVLHDLRKWRNDSAVVVLEPDAKYKGFQTMKDEDRLREANDYNLDEYEDAKKLLQLFQDRYKDCPTKKYFAFRIGSSEARVNIRNACVELGWDEPQNHDSEDRVVDIDGVMEEAPRKHKVFFVKGFWRASKRLVRKHVGGTYESPTVRSDDTSKSQGLTARFCNTFEWEGEQNDINLRPLHFDDVSSIDRYLGWWSKDCDYSEAAYSAPRLRSNGEGAVKHPKTKTDPGSVAGVEVVDEDPTVSEHGPQVPVGINITEDEYATVPTGERDKPGKIRSVLPILERQNPALADRLRGYTCKQFYEPPAVDEDSYRNHVGVAVGCMERGDPCRVALGAAATKKGKIWNCFIDKHSTPKRLFFVYANPPPPA
jgi:hypothetical protein